MCASVWRTDRQTDRGTDVSLKRAQYYYYYYIIIIIIILRTLKAGRLFVCLSVRHVPRWHCVETAQPRLYRKTVSLPGSPVILVFWGSNFFPEWEHPNGGVKCKGAGKSCNFPVISDQYLAIARKRLKIYGYSLCCCVWPALNPLSIHVTFTAIVQGAYQG